MTPADTAGAPGVNVANWNNMRSNQSTAGGSISGSIAAGQVVDDSGNLLGSLNVTWAGNGVANAGGTGANDALMWTSEWDLFGGTPDMAITVSGIPYPVYDVYFYVEDANNAAVRGGDVDANGTVKSIIMFNAPNVDYIEADSSFTWGAATTEVGNYLRITGVTGSTLLLQMEAKNAPTPRLRMAGFQIVQTNTELPAIANLEATLVTFESATANGDLLNNGDGAEQADVTILWGATDGGTDAGAWANSISVGTFTEPDQFSAELVGLLASTTYYYRAFASNSAGNSWAPISQAFTTRPAPELPEVENLQVTNVDLQGATLNGDLLSNGIGADHSDLTIYWGSADGGTDPLAWENSVTAGSLMQPGVFSATVSGLAAGTQYFFRCFANNSAGPDWASSTEFFFTKFPPVNAISLNFVRSSSGQEPLEAFELAGVVPAVNWNNATIATANMATGFALLNDCGEDTGATADWQSGGASWSTLTVGSGGAADMKMMTGYLDQSGDGNGQIHTITVNDLPYATYDVYLYHSSSGGPNRSARFRANGVDLFTRNLALADTFDGFFIDQHPSIEESNDSATGGNYVVWEGLSGTLSIEAQGIGAIDGGFLGSGDTRRAPIQGIQIVSASPAAEFAITAIVYNPVEGTVMLSWNSEIDRSYFIEASTSMTAEGQPGGWEELDDFTATETISTYTNALPDPSPERLFFRIRR